MKIVLISYKFFPDVGGIEVNSELLADYFFKFGAQVRVVTTSGTDSLNTREFPYEIIRNPNKSELIKQYRWADVVFENNPSLTLSWPLLIVNRPHCVALNTWVGPTEGKLKFQDKLKLKWLAKADAVIAVSEKVKELTFAKSIVIGNPYRENLFVDLHVDKTLDFVFLGRLVSDKGVDMAVDLLNELSKDAVFNERKFTLTIIGDGPEKAKLTQMVADYKLTDHVNFTGTLRGSELVNCINKHKYLLAPSRWREPFGNIAIEGMACGCLPIVSDGGGLIDAVGKAGAVFERNNIESLVQVVKKILLNPDEEAVMRSEFEKHLENHKPEFVARKYFKILENISK